MCMKDLVGVKSDIVDASGQHEVLPSIRATWFPHGLSSAGCMYLRQKSLSSGVLLRHWRMEFMKHCPIE